jgi:hypothetical protein
MTRDEQAMWRARRHLLVTLICGASAYGFHLAGWSVAAVVAVTLAYLLWLLQPNGASTSSTPTQLGPFVSEPVDRIATTDADGDSGSPRAADEPKQ